MADILRIIVFQLCAAFLCGKYMYRQGKFLYSRCTHDTGDPYRTLKCEPLNITKARREKSSLWPPGPYAILKSNGVCPEPESHGWKKSIFRIKAPSEDNEIQLNFCVKIDRKSTLDKGKWMAGTYSIYMTGVSCPEGFADFNQTMVYEIFSHFGPVPNFSITDDSEMKTITFHICGRNSTNVSRDESEVGTADTQFLCKMFMENEECARRPGIFARTYALEPGYYVSSGTLPGDEGIMWYQLDLGITLSMVFIYIRKISIGEWYHGCYYSNVKWEFTQQAAAVCNVSTYVYPGFNIDFRNVVQARFITLLFKGLQTLPSKEDFYIYPLPEFDMCNEDLGMVDGSIQDFQIAASSWLPQYVSTAARPFDLGWCADVTDSNPWILVDLIAVTRVEGLSIWIGRGSQHSLFHNSSGCSPFDLFYGLDIETLTMYNDTDFLTHERLMTEAQTFILLNSIETRYVKLEIRKCVDLNNRCLRLELHGCKLAGIPTLDCQNEFDMFELEREIRTEGNPVIYKNRNSYVNCSSRCLRNDTCSIASYSNEEYCIEYPSSKLGMWHIADTFTGKWSAKLCAEDYVELFPILTVYGTTALSNVEYIEKDSVIRSIGYPFSYGNRQLYTWIIKYSLKRYVKIVFTNVSLSNVNEECYDRLGIDTKFIVYGLPSLEINPKHNGKSFVIETKESILFLTFTSCHVQRKVTDSTGLRAIVTGEEIPACLAIARHDWSDARREVCEKPKMVITSTSVLSLPYENELEFWEIRAVSDVHYTVQLQIIEFYVVCLQISEDFRSRFAVFDLFEERTFCNTDKPPDVIYSKSAPFSLKYRRHTDPKAVYIRTEGFRLHYSIIDHSLDKIKDQEYLDSKDGYVTNTVCSKTFWKCYNIKVSLTTWDQASEICRKCKQTLVAVKSEYELQFVNYILRDHRYLNKNNENDAYLPESSFSSHIGLRRVNNRHGKKTYVWENDLPATYFSWKLGYRDVGKDCTRTKFEIISNRTLESEDCSTDLSSYFVCQSQMTENKYGEEEREACEDTEDSTADIVFMLQWYHRDILYYEYIFLDFVRNLVSNFNIGPHATQIAIVTFSDITSVEFYLDEIKTNEEARYKLQNIYSPQYGRNTNLALEVMRLDLFAPSNGARDNVPRIGILLTAESSTNRSKTLEQARLARTAGINLVAIGIGKEEVREELEEVVSKPSRLNYVHLSGMFDATASDVRLHILQKITKIATTANRCKYVVWRKWKLTKSINITSFGTTCQTWTALTLPAENDFKARFPDFDIPIEAHNFCQDPDTSGILWCYTEGSGQYLWEPCFLQLSNMESKYVISENADKDANNCEDECDGKSTQCNIMCDVCDGIFDRNDFSDETLCRVKGHYLTNNETESLTEKPPERIERGSYFLCGSKEWISFIAQCDDVIDCVDASDELSCSSLDNGFSEKVFSCNDGDCQICDFISDNTTTVEDLHEFRACESGEYECKNKQCIPMDKRCNAMLDCIDGSDEKQCDSCKDSFHCDNAKCIPLRLNCDTVQDCEDGTDENCMHDSFSSCDQWWEHGYHTSGYYVIDDMSVYCDFSSIKISGKITMSVRNIDAAVDGDRCHMYTRSLSDNTVQFSTPKFRDLIFRDGYLCFLEVKRTCQFPVAASIIDGLADNDAYKDCQCTIESFKAEKSDQSSLRNSSYLNSTSEYNFVRHKSFHCNRREHSEDQNSGGYYNVTGDGIFYIDGRILKREIPIQIVPEQIVCTYEYRNDAIVCVGEHRTIPSSAMCVYDFDNAGVMTGCRSGSHLRNCGNFTCPPNTVKCPKSYCIPLKFVCDGSVHCPEGEDEQECACTNTAREVLILVEEVSVFKESTTAAVKLASQFYRTGSDVRLLYFKPQAPLKEYKIEHRLLEIREEQYSGYSFQSLNSTTECRFKSMARNLLGQIQFSTNYTKGIVFIEDSLESSKVAELMFSNLSKQGFMIFRVFEDTNFIVRHGIPGTYKFVKDIPIHRWNALFFIGYKRFPEICKAATEVPCSGGYRCASSKQCILLDQVCDGIAQCHSQDDERLCYMFCPHNCTCIGYTVSCREANLKYNDTKTLSLYTRIADMSGNPHLNAVLMNSSFRFLSMTKLNLSSCEIANVNKNGFSYLRNLKCLDIGYNRIKVLPDSLFSNLEHLVYLNIDGNFDLQEISSTAFHRLRSIKHLRITGTKLKRVSSSTFSYLTLQSIDISNNEITEIEDHAFNATSVEKIDFRGNNILTLNKKMFDGVSLLEELQTPSFKFCCIRPCSLDESNCFPPKNEFSSCEDLIRHPVLQAVLWIVGTTSLLGNLGSIFYRIVHDRERLKIGYGIFVTNLAGADFLMGVYLIMIAIADSFYRNRYIFFDDKWRNSAWCVTAGILSTVSSEASVLFVCLITLDRLLVIKYPFGTKKLDPRKAHICCIISWVVALLIALIPVVYTGYFEDRFYSRSAVCVAIPLTRDKPPGWMYSVSIFVGLNFCTFMLVAFGQLSIFLELRKATAGMKKTQVSRKRDLQVARNLIFVATTDFLCWFPIGVMGIMALSGYPVPGDVYAWTVVFILPLNSALNPILYTLTAIIGKQSFNPNIEEQNRIEVQKEIASGILRHQELTRYVRLKSEMLAHLGQNMKDLLEKDEPIPIVAVTAIGIQLSRYLCHLHEAAIGIEKLSTDTTYVKVSKKKRHRVNTVLESKISVSNDGKILQDNIYQFGIIIRRLLAKRKHME